MKDESLVFGLRPFAYGIGLPQWSNALIDDQKPKTKNQPQGPRIESIEKQRPRSKAKVPRPNAKDQRPKTEDDQFHPSAFILFPALAPR
jgi:hypothetical protein